MASPRPWRSRMARIGSRSSGGGSGFGKRPPRESRGRWRRDGRLGARQQVERIGQSVIQHHGVAAHSVGADAAEAYGVRRWGGRWAAVTGGSDMRVVLQWQEPPACASGPVIVDVVLAASTSSAQSTITKHRPARAHMAIAVTRIGRDSRAHPIRSDIAIGSRAACFSRRLPRTGGGSAL
jgi:hypothetical protein